MTRFTVDRSTVRAEAEQQAAAAAEAAKAASSEPASTTNGSRWSAKVFVVPTAVAEALTRLATRRLFAAPEQPQIGERHSMRRHRGVYIWRPAMDQGQEQESADQLLSMQDIKTAETEIAKLKH